LGELYSNLGRTDQASSFMKDAAETGETFEEMGMVSRLDKTREILNKLQPIGCREAPVSSGLTVVSD
jgi:hypothetical protein